MKLLLLAPSDPLTNKKRMPGGIRSENILPRSAHLIHARAFK
jgi:hypothetical protein